MGLMLTDAERERFASWLENEAASSDALVEQMVKLGTSMSMSDLAKKYRVNGMAQRLVAKLLRSIESQTIGGGDKSEMKPVETTK